MRKHTSRAQQPGLRADGFPNRAMRRHMPHESYVATMRVFYAIAARLVPGYVWAVEGESDAQQAA